MRIRNLADFTTIQTEGAILPPDLLTRVRKGEGDLEGLRSEDYHLDAGEKLNERVSRSWNRIVGAWSVYQTQAEKVKEDDPGTTVTRERWLLPLFEELGYGRLQTSKAQVLNGKSYPISHEWGKAPIHLVGFNISLDRRTAGVAGAARTSPHSLVQEFLNRSDDHLWAFLSNGKRLRILRDNASLTRQAYVEFDLEAMMEGEVYADFVLLWLLCHQSRVEGEIPEEFWLERWSQAAQERGTRALEQLRKGVEQAISILGAGYLTHGANRALKERLREGDLDPQDYYRQLLRLVYRLIFLFVAEDRNLLFDSEADAGAKARYQKHYSTARLRSLAERRRGTRHPDLYRGLCVVMAKLGAEEGCPELGLPGLGGFLWSEEAVSDLIECQLANRDLLEMVRSLAFTEEKSIRRAVDYKNLGPEELGSVYESLLELQPEMNVDAPTFELKVVGGSERKTTGSYYTPTSLIQCLLDSALDPVIEEALKKEDPEQALLDLKVCDPACGSGHFLVAAAHRLARRLASVRTGDEEPSPEAQRGALREVIGRCIYGVDINPMAVELCKVNLWLEAIVPGKPLTFLDNQILCGNSLLGTTPALLAKGIPDEAFKVIEGDDKKLTSSLKKQNKQERSGQMSMFGTFGQEEKVSYALLQKEAFGIAETVDSSVGVVREKGKKYQALLESKPYRHSKMIADAWCAAFVWRKTEEAPEAITEASYRKLGKDLGSISDASKKEIERLSEQYQFFHWHLAFPGVFWLPEGEGDEPENEHTGWSRGFDCVLGNPPWDRLKPEATRYFLIKNPEISNAKTASMRGRLIEKLNESDQTLYNNWKSYERFILSQVKLITLSRLFPRSAIGKFNLGNIFVELSSNIMSTKGMLGLLNVSGLATDDCGKVFISYLINSKRLVSFFDFENRKKLFPSVDSRYKFSAISIAGTGNIVDTADFVFFAHSVTDLKESFRHIQFSDKDIRLLNPLSLNVPVFRSRRQADIVKKIYIKADLCDSGEKVLYKWDAEPTFMFVMSDHSNLFVSREDLDIKDFAFPEIMVTKGDKRYRPLYESKMFHQYNHRWSHITSEGKQINLTEKDWRNPTSVSIPRYWMEANHSDTKLGKLPHNWLIAIRGITNPTNERTAIATIIPKYPVGHSAQVFKFHHSAEEALLFISMLNSFVFDFAARTKIGSTEKRG